jgi:hypothetical protein
MKVKVCHVHTWTNRALLTRWLGKVIHVGNSQRVSGRNADDRRDRLSIEGKAVTAIIAAHSVKG